MDAYIYDADIYCEACGHDICERLTREGCAPADLDERTYDSGEYPKGPYTDGGGESDCPQHCADCGAYLENPLTTDGVDYALGYVREQLKRGEVNDVTLTWAHDLRDYCLDAEDSATVDDYIDMCDGIRTVRLTVFDEPLAVKVKDGAGSLDGTTGDDTLDSFILAAACEGIEVDSPRFVRALETTLDALDNYV